jgi:hypothetical protein
MLGLLMAVLIHGSARLAEAQTSQGGPQSASREGGAFPNLDIDSGFLSTRPAIILAAFPMSAWPGISFEKSGRLTRQTCTTSVSTS